MAGPEHHFACKLTWTGAEAGPTTDYRSYSRTYRVTFDGKPALEGSAAPPFRGDGKLHNPEDLLMAALSACHCLSYLALCARARIPVLAYEDAAAVDEGHLAGGLQFVEVTLHPHVTVAEGADLDKAKRLHTRAHEECFIARSVAFPVRNEPVVTQL